MHVARPGGPAGADRAALADQRRLIESADGTYHQVTGDDIPAALPMFARAANATQLVLGATRQTRLAALRPAAAIRSRVICGASGNDVHIVTCIPTADGVPARGW